MFIGRIREMDVLHRLAAAPGFQFLVLYGRRRVGKTTLLGEFCRGRKAIFFVADEFDAKTSLDRFSRQLLSWAGLAEISQPFASWDAAFEFLASRTEQERVVLVLDEYPYLAEAYPRISSLLQNLIDHRFAAGQLFLILCGSSVGFMEREVLGEKSPLFGRRTAQIQLQPLLFAESRLFFPEWKAEDQLGAYGILGGIPQYLKQFAPAGTLADNVRERLLEKTAYLYEEPKNLLRQELRQPALYHSILTAVAGGASKIGEIADKIGEPSDKAAKYVGTLVDLRILKKELPIGVPAASRKTIYRMEDAFFSFWYRFVFPSTSALAQGMGAVIWSTRVEPCLNEYLGSVFEEVCRETLWQWNQAGRLPFVFDRMARWWGNDALLRREAELDIVATDGRAALVGECRWRNEPVGRADVEALLDKGRLLHFDDYYYVFFAKRGFRAGARELAADSNGRLTLVSFADMVK